MSSHVTEYPISLIAGREIEWLAAAHYEFDPAERQTRTDPGHAAHVNLTSLTLATGGNEPVEIDLYPILSRDQIAAIEDDLITEHMEQLAEDRASAAEARYEARYEVRRERMMERE